MDQVAILLTTYNSELFLEEQLDSIIKQTYENWIVYARDDSSKDDTNLILDRYHQKYPAKFIRITDELGNLGASHSFMAILSFVNAKYYMFCDHDDIWLPDKIEKTMSKMKIIEAEHQDEPIVVFTDLCVVDRDLNVISDSMWKYSHINPEYSKDVYLHSVASSVTGCTMLFNKPVKKIVLPYPDEACMHDWWIALNVVKYGIIDYVPEATILYRQHGNNTLGVEVTGKKHYFRRFIGFRNMVRDNIRVIKMLNKLNFKINHCKRLVIKIYVIFCKI